MKIFFRGWKQTWKMKLEQKLLIGEIIVIDGLNEENITVCKYK
ncbi:hypothetical protein [Clostridium sp. BL-8]|nr:hypothetical protein [Clostridium sp. BL-8]